MSRMLAVTWNANVLRFVRADTDNRGKLRIHEFGEKLISDVGTDSGDGPKVPADGTRLVLNAVRQLVAALKAEKSLLLVLLNRGSVDSSALTVPPASEGELPALVLNMVQRTIPGTSDETLMDFIAYPPAADGTRLVRAMALLGDDQQLVRQLMERSGCRQQRILVGTHPLRAYIPAEWRQQSDRTTLVIARGDETADIILLSGDLPVMSRTIRLAATVPADETTRYLTAEAQRTLISAGSQLSELPTVNRVLIVGSERQCRGLDLALSLQFSCDAEIQTPMSLLSDGDALKALPQQQQHWMESGSFAGLTAALSEEAARQKPVIDFASPRRPPVQRNRTGQWMAAAAGLIVLIGGGWYFVWSQLNEIDTQNARLVSRLNELNELVRDTQQKRRLAAALSTWETNRISWPDELRDLTNRIPASPDLVVQQLTAASAGLGKATITFRGVGRQPEVIQQMEASLRDSFHELRIPGIREQQEGNRSVWTFQTSMTIRSRTAAQYQQSGGTDDATAGQPAPAAPAASRQQAVRQ